jgi:hypothetical protein
MFDIERQPLITEVRCQSCHATLTIESDSSRMVERTTAAYVRKHRCRIIADQSKGGKSRGIKS